MSEIVAVEKRASIAVIQVNHPPVNALSRAVRAGLVAALDAVQADPRITAVVLACQGRTFIAGADITEFGKGPLEPSLPAVIERYDASPKPIVAAIHGTALGGGLELALGCNYRVATLDAKCGLPEVKLGILPGAGGTQRLPRLIGIERALEMIVGGESIGAREAHALGVLDAIIEGDLLEGALGFAERVAEHRPLPRVRDRARPEYETRSFESAERDALRRSRGAEAPLRCIAALKAAVELSFEEGLRRERELLHAALESRESAAMRHVFFAEREAAKIPDITPDTPVLPIRSVAVLGAGTMGGGISMAFANAGFQVKLLDRDRELVDRGLSTVHKNYSASIAKKRLTQAEVDARIARIQGGVNWDELADVDLVIEAVFEEMALKREIFGKLSAICQPAAILATNTSTLDVNEIARATNRPEQVIGLHFFSPANVMRLLEVVRGSETSRSVVASCMKLGKQIGKVSVLVGVCYGFVGNRMLHQYYREAQFLIQEGASPEQVDRVMTQFGFAMGPCATSDLAGIDVGWRIRKAQPKPPPGERYSGAVPDRLAEMGRFGQKTNAGFYKYERDSRTPVADPEVDQIIALVSKELGIERRAVADGEIMDRCLYALINEGAKILGEGIALRASDIDTVWINGYGFPAHRGGPMFYADTVGIGVIHGKLLEFRERLGKIWEPAPLLTELARQGSSFVAFDQRSRHSRQTS